MLLLLTPRSVRPTNLAALEARLDEGRPLTSPSERERLSEALRTADPGLVEVRATDEERVLEARGRSGLVVRLGAIHHDLFLPDWHEGEKGAWLMDRVVALLRVFPRVAGVHVLDPEEDRALDPAEWSGLVERYLYQNQPAPDAPLLPSLFVDPDDREAAERIFEAVFRRVGAGAMERAFFLHRAAEEVLERELAQEPVEVVYDPSVRQVRVVRADPADPDAEVVLPARLTGQARRAPPDVAEAVGRKDGDSEAIATLAAALTFAPPSP